GEDQLQLLLDKVATVPFFQDAEIYIDGFHRFTPKEVGIIAELLQTTKRVSIALAAPENVEETETTELDLFYQTSETYHTLLATAKEYEIPIEDAILPGEDYHRFTKAPVIAHLDKYFDERPAPELRVSGNHPIHLREAVHPRAEL